MKSRARQQTVEISQSRMADLLSPEKRNIAKCQDRSWYVENLPRRPFAKWHGHHLCNHPVLEMFEQKRGFCHHVRHRAGIRRILRCHYAAA